MLSITRTFVREWAREYNRLADPRDRLEERSLKAWLRGQPSVKHLDKKHFVTLAAWHAPRGREAYRRNDAALVREATRLASRTANEGLKVHILTVLEGVNITVAAKILHFLSPRLFPIFDVRARTTLKRAGLWPRPVSDASVEAWEEYVRLMRRLSHRLRVSLRDLDKALFAYDRWGRRRRSR
jgi:hypothetical protein